MWNEKDGDYEIAMINSLVRSATKSYLSLNTDAKRLLGWIVARGIKDHREAADLPQKLEVPVLEIAKELNLDKDGVYRQMKQAARELRHKDVVYYDHNTGETVECGWLSAQRYKDAEGYLTVSFDPAIKPALTGLNEHYTLMKYLSSSRLTGHAATLYAILASWKSERKWEPRWDDFCEQMLLPDTAYRTPEGRRNIKDIKKRIITPSVKKITEETELNVTCEKGNKHGRTWQWLRFNILQKSKDQQEIKHAKKTTGFEALDDNQKQKMWLWLCKTNTNFTGQENNINWDSLSANQRDTYCGYWREEQTELGV